FVNLGCDSATTINKAYPISKTSGFSSPRGDFSSNAQGTMTLTNISGGSIAGTFQFTAKNRDGSKTVTVTDGKFNSTYISR
ncbi:MAG TPA: hypothetical protein VEC36_10260, partial [Patescibacteria group bacterium]|nr:hypothetical protein [Patescibacteria group bacterium]